MARTKTTKRKKSKHHEHRGSKQHHFADASIQTGKLKSTYSRRLPRKNDDMLKFTTYEMFREQVLSNEEGMIQWCIENQLIVDKMTCSECGKVMNLKPTTDRLDGYVWICRRRIGGNKEHRVEHSIRSGSIFEGSNLSISEILQILYWWSIDLSQKQIQQQMSLSNDAVCAWHMKCREICEFVTMHAETRENWWCVYSLHVTRNSVLEIILKLRWNEEYDLSEYYENVFSFPFTVKVVYIFHIGLWHNVGLPYCL